MPLLTKLLFIAVGLGLLAVPILMARTPPRRRHQPQYRLEPIGRRRYNQMWVVDRDEE